MLFLNQYFLERKDMEKIRKRGNCKRGGIAEQIYTKTRRPLIEICEIRGISYNSLKNGYISKKTAKVLKEYGVKIA